VPLRAPEREIERCSRRRDRRSTAIQLNAFHIPPVTENTCFASRFNMFAGPDPCGKGTADVSCSIYRAQTGAAGETLSAQDLATLKFHNPHLRST